MDETKERLPWLGGIGIYTWDAVRASHLGLTGTIQPFSAFSPLRGLGVETACAESALQYSQNGTMGWDWRLGVALSPALGR